MEVYTLRFSDDAFGVARRLEFKARDMSSALVIAHREAGSRRVELWHGSRMLGVVERQANVGRVRLPPHKYRVPSKLVDNYGLELPCTQSHTNAASPERCHVAH
jgi:hypothetical protein